jgi:hypothetical protein
MTTQHGEDNNNNNHERFETNLKKSLTYIFQIHKKCLKSLKKTDKQQHICHHLIEFKRKIAEIIKVHNLNTNNINRLSDN